MGITVSENTLAGQVFVPIPTCWRNIKAPVSPEAIKQSYICCFPEESRLSGTISHPRLTWKIKLLKRDLEKGSGKGIGKKTTPKKTNKQTPKILKMDESGMAGDCLSFLLSHCHPAQWFGVVARKATQKATQRRVNTRHLRWHKAVLPHLALTCCLRQSGRLEYSRCNKRLCHKMAQMKRGKDCPQAERGQWQGGAQGHGQTVRTNGNVDCKILLLHYDIQCCLRFQFNRHTL